MPNPLDTVFEKKPEAEAPRFGFTEPEEGGGGLFRPEYAFLNRAIEWMGKREPYVPGKPISADNLLKQGVALATGIPLFMGQAVTRPKETIKGIPQFAKKTAIGWRPFLAAAIDPTKDVYTEYLKDPKAAKIIYEELEVPIFGLAALFSGLKAVKTISKIPVKAKSLLKEAAKPATEAEKFAAVQEPKTIWTPDQVERALKRGDALPKEILDEFPDIAKQFEAQVLPETPPIEINKAGLVQGKVTQIIRAPGEAINKFTGIRPTDEIARVAQDLISDFESDVQVGRFRAGTRALEAKKAFGKPAPQAIVERFRLREKTPSQLDDMLFYLQKTKNPYVKGDTPSKVAHRLSSEAKEAVAEYRKLSDAWREEAHATGFGKDIAYIENWIHQRWIIPRKKAHDMANSVRIKGAFENQRKFATLVEGINKGFKPRTTNFADMVQFSEEAYTRVIASRKLVKSIFDAHKSGIRAADGRPIATTSFNKIYADYIQLKHPALKEVTFGGKPKKAETILARKDLRFHPDFGEHLKAIFDESDIWNKDFVRLIAGSNAVIKSAWVRFGLFHHKTLVESAAATFGPISGTVRALKYSGGVPFISQVTRAIFPALKLDPLKAEYAIKSGLQVGPMTGIGLSQWRDFHMSAAEKLAGVPKVGKAVKEIPRTVLKVSDYFDDALWTHFHNGIKLEAFYELAGEMMKLKNQPPSGIKKIASGIRNKVFLRNVRVKDIVKLSETEIVQQVGSFVNDAFGGQRFEQLQVKWMKSKNGQRALRLTFLSPDWLVSQLRVMADVFGTQSPVKQALAVRYWRNAAIIHYAYMNILNYILTSLDPTTEAHFMTENEIGQRDNLQLPGWEETASGRMGRVYYVIEKQFKETFRMLADPPFSIAKYFAGKIGPTGTAISLIASGYTPSGYPSELKKERDKFYRGFRGPILGKERAELVFGDVLKFGLPIAAKSNQFFLMAQKKHGMNWYKAVDLLANASALDESGDYELINDVKKAMRDNNFSKKTINSALNRALGKEKAKLFYER